MSNLRNYWDSLSSEADAVSVEESLDKVLTTIERRRRARILPPVLLALAVLITAGVITIRPSTGPELIQCYVPNGQQRQLTLPDGTVVSLGAGSSVVYPEKFGCGNRSIIFSGEAIFEVAKDARHPFVVRTPCFEVEVLGTVFDISAWPELGQGSVVLSEGSVRIRHQGTETTLVPGQKADISRGGSVGISNVNPSDYMSWNRGGYVLERAGIDDIIRLLERTYGVEVRCSYSEKFRTVCITARSETERPIREFLTLLAELIPGMKYEITDETIYIY